jgi:protein-disulfide isomerase
VDWPLINFKVLLDDRMKKSALPFALFVAFFAVGTIATLALSDTLAAAAVVIPVEQQRLILKDSATAGLGAANSEVTVVEYFDYNCPYCRQLAPSIHDLVNNDHQVAVVMRGTAGLLVGRDVSTGISDLAALQVAVAEARRAP